MRALLFFIFLLSSHSVSSAENDFDKVCDFFKKLDSALIQRNAARQAWEVIGYAVPNERYEIYQSTAKELLKSNWQCSFMEKHISSTGD